MSQRSSMSSSGSPVRGAAEHDDDDDGLVALMSEEGLDEDEDEPGEGEGEGGATRKGRAKQQPPHATTSTPVKKARGEAVAVADVTPGRADTRARPGPRPSKGRKEDDAESVESVAESPAKASAKAKDVKQVYMPRAIFAKVDYGASDDANRAANVHAKQAAFAKYIAATCDVPADFETNRAFGPHSGETYETRLIRAFENDLVRPRGGPSAASPENVRRCWRCDACGHVSWACPSLVSTL